MNCSRTKGVGNIVIVWAQAGLWFDGGFHYSCTFTPKTLQLQLSPWADTSTKQGEPSRVSLHPCTPVSTAVPLSVPQCLWKRLGTAALMMPRHQGRNQNGDFWSETRMVGSKKGSIAGRSIYRNKSPLNFQEYYIRRLHFLPFIPPSKSTTIPRRALRAVVEQQVGLEALHLRHEQINSSKKEQLQL